MFSSIFSNNSKFIIYWDISYNVAIILLDGGSSGKLQIGLDLNVRDGLEETPLGLAIWTDQFDTAQRLLQMGAELEAGGGREEKGGRGGEAGLLYVAIVREKPRGCLFLLDHGADFKTRYCIYICTEEEDTLELQFAQTEPVEGLNIVILAIFDLVMLLCLSHRILHYPNYSWYVHMYVCEIIVVVHLLPPL